jgi:hypothetical protein
MHTGVLHLLLCTLTAHCEGSCAAGGPLQQRYRTCMSDAPRKVGCARRSASSMFSSCNSLEQS